MGPGCVAAHLGGCSRHRSHVTTGTVSFGFEREADANQPGEHRRSGVNYATPLQVNTGSAPLPAMLWLIGKLSLLCHSSVLMGGPLLYHLG